MKELARNISGTWITLKSIFNTGDRIVFLNNNKSVLPVIKNAQKNKQMILFFSHISSIENLEYDFMYFSPKKVDFDFRSRFNNLTRIFRDYFLNLDIKYFVVDRLKANSVVQRAALVAANSIRQIKTIYLEHGHSGGYHPEFVEIILNNYDYFYSLDSSMQRYMRKEAFRLGIDISIGGWEEQEMQRGKQDKNWIIYAPSLMWGDTYPWLYPDVLRYHHKLEILKKLSFIKKNLPKCRIIYKMYSKGNEEYDPIPDLIKDKYKNEIEVIDNYKLLKLLKHARGFITDSVSTPLYNAITMGVPSLCLRYDRSIEIRKDIRELWKDVIYDFLNTDEIGEIMYEWFLNPGKAESISNTITKFPWEK